MMVHLRNAWNWITSAKRQPTEADILSGEDTEAALKWLRQQEESARRHMRQRRDFLESTMVYAQDTTHDEEDQ